MDINKIEIAKSVVDKYVDRARCGMFSYYLPGDETATIYKEHGVQVDMCSEWEYFVVFGLNNKEFEKVYDYYKNKRTAH